jgi:type I restriction enzyme R subunit
MAGAVKNPEQQARQTIDTALRACGWVVQHYEQMNLAAAQGIAVREFPLASGFGRADYALYVGEELVGAVEAKKGRLFRQLRDTDAEIFRRRA